MCALYLLLPSHCEGLSHSLLLGFSAYPRLSLLMGGFYPKYSLSLPLSLSLIRSSTSSPFFVLFITLFRLFWRFCSEAIIYSFHFFVVVDVVVALFLCFNCRREHGAHFPSFSLGILFVTFWLAEAARVINRPEPFIRGRTWSQRQDAFKTSEKKSTIHKRLKTTFVNSTI